MRKLILALALIMSTTPALAETYNGYETPSFTVIKDYGDIETRSYGPVTEALVSRPGQRSSAVGAGFRALAGYIFGGNASDQKIKMTAPVVQEQINDAWKVSFILPSSVTPDTAPMPDNSDVSVETRSAYDVAVIQFSGLWTEARLTAHEDKLRSAMRSNGLIAKGRPIYMFYNDPMTLPWKRRNEIALRIK